MKTLKKLKQVAVLTLLILVTFVFKSDIIPTGGGSSSSPQRVERKVFITNCSDFPEVSFFGFLDDYVLTSLENIIPITENEAIRTAYYYDESIYIAAIDNTLLEEIDGFKNLSIETLFQQITPQRILASSEYYLEDNSMLESDEIFYEIVKYNNENYTAHLIKRVLSFSDDTKETITF